MLLLNLTTKYFVPPCFVIELARLVAPLIMSSSGSLPAGGQPNRQESGSRADSENIWHPAREWLEEDDDEEDLDYHPWTDPEDNDGMEEDIWEDENPGAVPGN